MDDAYTDLLDLLRNVIRRLNELTELANQKVQAVRQDDLIALEQILNREQAVSLSLRGLEQKKNRLLEKCGAAGLPLAELPSVFSPSDRLQAVETVKELRRQYQVYRHAADVARNILECNLHEIEKFLDEKGGRELNGPGYEASSVEPPKNMRTDIRV